MLVALGRLRFAGDVWRCRSGTWCTPGEPLLEPRRSLTSAPRRNSKPCGRTAGRSRSSWTTSPPSIRGWYGAWRSAAPPSRPAGTW